MSEEESSRKLPRRVRKIETVRQKAEKSQVEVAAKKRGPVRRFFRVIFWPFRMAGRGLKWIGHFKVFRFIGLILLPRYFRNSWKELKLVTWPTKRESRRLTLAVMIFAIVFGVLVASIDYGLDRVFKRILLK